MKQKYYPKVKFKIDLEAEKKFILNRQRNLQKFLPAGMAFVLRDEFIKNKDQILSAYLETYYFDQKKQLHQSVLNTTKKWEQVSQDFFKKVDKLFSGWAWPKGNYRGYVSIARSHPRFIKEKMFSFPMINYRPGREDIDLRITAHEMLHFIEYDYFEKKFGLIPSECNSVDNFFWQFTENLNVLIENSDFWSHFSLGLTSEPYPDCKKLYNKMKKIWDKDQSIDNLVMKIFQVKLG
ncbi:MAG: hypothetical protein WCX88_00815 [Patescibacteria group bacterium]